MLVILVLATGFAGVLASRVAWKGPTVLFDLKYLPQLFWGMIVLILLFSIYVKTQKKELTTVGALVQELIVRDNVQAFSLLDPATQLLNCFAIERIASKEVARANRLSCPLTFATVSVENYKSIQERVGAEEGEQALYYAARLLNKTFRESDVIFRSGPHEFLVLMPDTTEKQAEDALLRLGIATERWNSDSEKGFAFAFSKGIAPYVPGANTRDVLDRTRRRRFLSSQKLDFMS